MNNPKRRLLFVHISKTGGTSVERALGLIKIHQRPEYKISLIKALRLAKIPLRALGLVKIHQRALDSVLVRRHKTAREQRKEVGEKCWRESFSFSIVRNPWDRVVSHYHYRIKTNQTNLKTNPVEFKDWVKLSYRDKNTFYYDYPKMFMPQLDWISDDDGKILVNYICKFENLQTDFEEVCQLVNRPRKVLSHLNKGNRQRDYKSYYDEETRLIIERCFQKDIEKFGYKF